MEYLRRVQYLDKPPEMARKLQKTNDEWFVDWWFGIFPANLESFPMNLLHSVWTCSKYQFHPNNVSMIGGRVQNSKSPCEMVYTQHHLVRCMLHHWHEHLKETHPWEIVSRTWTSGQPWNGPFGKGKTPARGRKLTMVINHLLTGIILQVKPSSAAAPSKSRHIHRPLPTVQVRSKADFDRPLWSAAWRQTGFRKHPKKLMEKTK